MKDVVMCDCIEAKSIACTIQDNGIIRRADNGLLIGRLVSDVSYEQALKEEPLERTGEE